MYFANIATTWIWICFPFFVALINRIVVFQKVLTVFYVAFYHHFCYYWTSFFFIFTIICPLRIKCFWKKTLFNIINLIFLCFLNLLWDYWFYILLLTLLNIIILFFYLILFICFISNFFAFIWYNNFLIRILFYIILLLIHRRGFFIGSLILVWRKIFLIFNYNKLVLHILLIDKRLLIFTRFIIIAIIGAAYNFLSVKFLLYHSPLTPISFLQKRHSEFGSIIFLKNALVTVLAWVCLTEKLVRHLTLLGLTSKSYNLVHCLLVSRFQPMRSFYIVFF